MNQRAFLKKMMKDNVSKIKCEKEAIRTDSAAPGSSSSHSHIKVTPVQEVLVHDNMKTNKLSTVTWGGLKCRVTSTLMPYSLQCEKQYKIQA